METGNCHICGHLIFNGIPNGRDINEFIKEKETEGYRLGYFKKPVGSFGHGIEWVKQEPICNKCSQENHDREAKKTLIRQIKKVKPTLKKVYVCPIYTGFGECNHQADNKDDMVKHICDRHTGHDLERFVRRLNEQDEN